ncbi:MAG: dihydrodipicolinate synthase family protein [Chloroflexi bacterium]|nr:MAG: dihydrodipicolinate synthase family protein [Chloroflexota bacterium]
MFALDRVSGVLVALATPLNRDGSVDEPSITRLVEHVLAGGVHGLLPLGSTGEGAALDEAARRRVLSAVVEAGAGRVPVICGVAQASVASVRTEIESAARLGADAVLVAPPFYYPMDQASVLAFYRRIAEAAPVPILVYNIPQFTKVVVEPATIATLAAQGAVKGVKDSSRDFEYFEGVCIATREVDGFRVFTGSDSMLVASLAAGGSGTICGAANIAPDWVVRVYDDYARGDLAAARAGQDKVYQLVMALRGDVFPSAIKAALHMLDICEPWPAPPATRLDERLESRLRDRLAELGLHAAERSRH